jgi:hypothetical protein
MKLLVLIGVLSLAQSQPATNVTGTWEWEGAAGWQRIILTLKSDGSNLTGVIRMGPGSHEPESPSDFWEYFFDPVDFKISNGTVSGNRINFEHSYARAPVTIQPALAFGARPATRSAADTKADPKFVYRGLVQANEIVMTRELINDQKDAWALGVHRVEFVLRRVK